MTEGKKCKTVILKVNRELGMTLRRLVYLKYDGDKYGNVGKEADEAIKIHIAKLKKEITPDMKKKWNQSLDEDADDTAKELEKEVED